jgi:hypothetical protein
VADRRRQLVWRAALLSEHGAGADEQRLRARAALAELGLRVARLAAASCIGRSLAPKDLLIRRHGSGPELMPAWRSAARRNLAAQQGGSISGPSTGTTVRDDAWPTRGVARVDASARCRGGQRHTRGRRSAAGRPLCSRSRRRSCAEGGEHPRAPALAACRSRCSARAR